MRILSVGEILWDVVDGAEHLGGAPLNFGVHARRLGHEVRFLSAVGDDERGERALAAVRTLGLRPADIQRISEKPTGIVTVDVREAGQPAFTIHRPAAYDFFRLSAEELEDIVRWRADWIAFGTLFQTASETRAAVERILSCNPAARRFYDVNLRPNSYTPALVRALLATADVVKLNEDETSEVTRICGRGFQPLEAWCRAFAAEYGWGAVCVTRGERGCAVLIGSEYAEIAGYAVEVRDTIGAGDAFAAAFLHSLGNAWPPAKAGDFANRVGALVASRNGGTPPWSIAEVAALRHDPL